MQKKESDTLQLLRLSWAGSFAILIITCLLSVSIGGLFGHLLINSYGIETMQDLQASITPENTANLTLLKVVQGILHLCTYTIPTFLVAWFLYRGQSLTYLRMTKGPDPLVLLKATGLIIALFPLVSFIYYWNTVLIPAEWVAKKTLALEELLMQNQSLTDLAVNLLVFAVFAGVGEELLFRGLVQRFFYQWQKNSHLAIWLTGLLFSLIHFQPEGFIPRLLLGVVFGYLFLLSGSLWVPILLHTFFNGSQILVKYFSSSETISVDKVQEVPLLPVLIGSGIAFILWRNLAQKKADFIYKDIEAV